MASKFETKWSERKKKLPQQSECTEKMTRSARWTVIIQIRLVSIQFYTRDSAVSWLPVTMVNLRGHYHFENYGNTKRGIGSVRKWFGYAVIWCALEDTSFCFPAEYVA